MKKVKIKNTDLEVSALNFGGNVFGWTLDEKQSFALLDAIFEAGINFIDTADMYSYWVNGGEGGQSETIIGKWIKARGNRNQVVIATKVGGETGIHPIDTSKKHILKTVDESLKRLQTDCIDLYYTHFDDGVTPVEETLDAYDQIIKAGKVRYIAASNLTPERLSASFEAAAKYNLPNYVALQPHYNLMVRESFEKEYAPLVKQYDLSVFTYWSLEAGFLTGKYKTEADFENSARGNGIKKHFTPRGKEILTALETVANKHRTTSTTIALCWLIANPLVTAPIVSATNEHQLQALLAVNQVVLDQSDLDVLTQASAY